MLSVIIGDTAGAREEVSRHSRGLVLGMESIAEVVD